MSGKAGREAWCAPGNDNVGKQAIAQELELGQSTAAGIAYHFRLKNKFFPWLKGGIIRYAMARIWKRWTEELWERLGEAAMDRMWTVAQRIGLRNAARVFKLTIAEMKAVGRAWGRPTLTQQRCAHGVDFGKR